MSVPSSLRGSDHDAHLQEQSRSSSTTGSRQHSSPGQPTTRTVAIIKNHALIHRFEIERRIQEASFEIVKERQMEFDTETDPDTLFELFDEDARSLAEGPVWVYVLERRRAVEVWKTLMGNPDPEIAKEESPNSLRALYGISRVQNGLMGAADNHIAEVQIASLFVSSPPFPTSDLPDERYGTMNSVSSSVLSALRRGASEEGYAPSNVTSPSTVNGSSTKLNGNGKPSFKARPLPSTHLKPDIVPRTTKSAALRAGEVIEKKPATPRVPLSKEQLAKTFANVPGHKRAEVIQVASTAAPTIAPRMTRAASLRLGQKPAAPAIPRKALSAERIAKTFEGVPGHKRRETIAVASIQAPTIAPRLNKSAALRVQKDQAPPSSFKAGSVTKTSTTKLPPRPASQASGQAIPSRTTSTRSASVAGHNLSVRSVNGDEKAPAAKPRPRPSSIAAPSIAPRTNRSAALRAAKQEQTHAAAAAAAMKKARTKAPPSSFKPIAA